MFHLLLAEARTYFTFPGFLNLSLMVAYTLHFLNKLFCDNAQTGPEVSSPGPEVIKKIMLSLAEHEILNACKYKIIKKLSFYQAQISYNAFFLLVNVKCQQLLTF